MGTMRSSVQLDLGARTAAAPRAATPVEPGMPFRILVLGDFSGRGSNGTCEPDSLATRPCRPVDRDIVDDVFAALAPRIRIALGNGGGGTEVHAANLDELHPDILVDRVDVFAQLRALRQRLLDPATSAAAIAELRRGSGADQAPAVAEAAPADWLEGSLRATEAARPVAGGGGFVDDLVRELVTPHLVPRPDPRQADLVADVDRATAELLRAVLTAPAFREVEGAWLGLSRLVRELETDARLSIHVLDVSRAELVAALPEQVDALQSPLAARLGASDTGGPFALVVGAWSFGATAADIGVLARLGRICGAAGAPLLAAADPVVFGCPGFASGADPDDWNASMPADAAVAWQALREAPEAAAVGLVAPRFLGRLPYGARSSPVSRLPFEEYGGAGVHEQLPWVGGAFLVAIGLARDWQQGGWGMRPGRHDEIGGLPLFVRDVDGSTELVPVAEVELTERGGERLAAHGVIALYGVRGTDAVRVGQLRSLANDGRPLCGRWSGG